MVVNTNIGFKIVGGNCLGSPAKIILLDFNIEVQQQISTA